MAIIQRHGSAVSVPRRNLTNEEQQWVRDITLANPLWADADLGELFVIGECSCGCRTIIFEEPRFVQNPQEKDHQGPVGEMTIRIKNKNRNVEDVVTLLLHQTEGKLTDLEVVWYNFPEPVPKTWVEVGRTIRSGCEG